MLLGEATHGTSEFYRMRARITRELILRRGFTVDRGRGRLARRGAHRPLRPRIWAGRRRRGRRSRAFRPGCGATPRSRSSCEWLHLHNADVAAAERRVGFFGLDLYSLYTSIAAVLRYLDDVDPDGRRGWRASATAA